MCDMNAVAKDSKSNHGVGLMMFISLRKTKWTNAQAYEPNTLEKTTIEFWDQSIQKVHYARIRRMQTISLRIFSTANNFLSFFLHSSYQNHQIQRWRVFWVPIAYHISDMVTNMYVYILWWCLSCDWNHSKIRFFHRIHFSLTMFFIGALAFTTILNN